MSDDSSEDDSAYSTTNVLLGYASAEPTGDEISFLGGTPSWLGDIKPSYDLFQCKVCQSPLSQLLQLNGELPEQFPTHDRRLHILACRRKTCARKPGSIRALRATRHSNAATIAKPKQQSVASAKPNVTLGNDIFGAGMPSSSLGANPFSKASPSTGNAAKEPKQATLDEPTYSSAAQTSHTPQGPKPRQPWPTEPVNTNSFLKLYLDADYESIDETKSPQPSLAQQIPTFEDETAEANGSSSSTKEDSETFESDLDKAFLRFADRLAQNPEQVLRYEFKGNPLLYSATDEVGKIFNAVAPAKVSTARRGIPGCDNCSKSRTFELQLTPHTILELEGNDISLDGMDWGTIIVGVCEVDCQERGIESSSVGYIEEWVGVQWEETKK